MEVPENAPKEDLEVRNHVLGFAEQEVARKISAAGGGDDGCDIKIHHVHKFEKQVRRETSEIPLAL